MKRKRECIGRPIKCFRCRVELFRGSATTVQCPACGHGRRLCSTCGQVFVGCDEECRERRRIMISSDAGQLEVLNLSRKRRGRRKEGTYDPGQGLF